MVPSPTADQSTPRPARPSAGQTSLRAPRGRSFPRRGTPATNQPAARTPDPAEVRPRRRRHMAAAAGMAATPAPLSSGQWQQLVIESFVMIGRSVRELSSKTRDGLHHSPVPARVNVRMPPHRSCAWSGESWWRTSDRRSQAVVSIIAPQAILDWSTISDRH